jgi:hypothetical protein
VDDASGEEKSLRNIEHKLGNSLAASTSTVWKNIVADEYHLPREQVKFRHGSSESNNA